MNDTKEQKLFFAKKMIGKPVLAKFEEEWCPAIVVDVKDENTFICESDEFAGKQKINIFDIRSHDRDSYYNYQMK